MPIIVSDSGSNRGAQDARRHREKQREAIRERLPEIISRETIITDKKGKKVRIPIRALDIPHFRPSRGDSDVGVGQGGSQGPGDEIGRRPGDGEPGESGTEPGRDYIETEVSIEELIEMMLEDLGLPRLEEQKVREIMVELGYRIAGIQKTGPQVLLDKRRSAREGMRTFFTFLAFLQTETGYDELTCYNALKQAQGIVSEALLALKNGEVPLVHQAVEPFPLFYGDELRYLALRTRETRQSRAVVIPMMDVSGSMTEMKKYFARSMIFWLVEFLRKLYERVEIRFIIHHAEAMLVPEDEFFKTATTGGTNCYTAYELARGLLETEYPPDSWNVYVWHFSDGEDFGPERTVEELKRLLEMGINMFGYGEIDPDSGMFPGGMSSDLSQAFIQELSLQQFSAEDLHGFVGKGDVPILGVLLEKKEHILPALKQFLKKDRWSHDEK